MSEEYFATKYSSAEHELLWDLATMYDWKQDETGTTESPVGYNIRLSVDRAALDAADVDEAISAIGYPVDKDAVPGHYVLSSNDQGFCYVVAYDTEEERDAEWDRLEQAYSEWDDQD